MSYLCLFWFLSNIHTIFDVISFDINLISVTFLYQESISLFDSLRRSDWVYGIEDWVVYS